MRAFRKGTQRSDTPLSPKRQESPGLKSTAYGVRPDKTSRSPRFSEPCKIVSQKHYTTTQALYFYYTRKGLARSINLLSGKSLKCNKTVPMSKALQTIVCFAPPVGTFRELNVSKLRTVVLINSLIFFFLRFIYFLFDKNTYANMCTSIKNIYKIIQNEKIRKASSIKRNIK